MKRLLRRCSAAVLGLLTTILWSGAHAESNPVAKTILDYSQFPTASEVSNELPTPVSAFHAWQSGDAEAEKILASWEKEALTVPWTRIQLERYVKHKMMPTRGARGLALVHVAMHDALVISNTTKVSSRLAVSMAAAQVLAYLFPVEERAFDRIAFSVAARIYEAKTDALPGHVLLALAVGRTVGERVIKHGESDGAQRGWNGIRLQWYGDGRYYGPGTWEPTPPYFYYPPDEPFAPTWMPWVLSSGAEFRSQPPAFGSPAYLRDLQEVVDTQRNLAPTQLRIAKFWVDGHGSVTPPGHWNQIAIDELRTQRMDDERAARLFAILNMSMADTFIAAWNGKYHYWTVRPITAAKQLLGVDYKSAILTPPFPSFPSGHAAFSGSAAEVLGAFFPARREALRAMGRKPHIHASSAVSTSAMTTTPASRSVAKWPTRCYVSKYSLSTSRAESECRFRRAIQTDLDLPRAYRG